MSVFGGYFELESEKKGEYHENGIRLNTGRNALEYILKANNYKKIYIPYYTCDVIFEPITKLGLCYEFYNINEEFEPIFDFGNIKANDAFLYTNYFGLKDCYIHELALHCENLIIDNAQSFYSKPITGVDMFYSPRKFFGVPDGAYLFSKHKLNIEFDLDTSFSRFEHLLVRIDKGPEYGYAAFNQSEQSLSNNAILGMSKLTQRILASINYDVIKQRRIANFDFLNSAFEKENQLKIGLTKNQVPLIYPLLIEVDDLRTKLISSKIYCPQYWPNVLEWALESSLEFKYCEKLVFLPIDQRYSISDMGVLVTKVKNIIEGYT